MPEFEFDPAKSEANLLKHGMDFTEAQALWRGFAPHRGSGTDDGRASVDGDRSDRRPGLVGGGDLSR